MPVVEAVPNFSEGRNEQVVRAIVSAIAAHGAEILDWSMDPDHNRSVITFVGTPAQVEAGALAGARIAVDRIDLRQHRGVHPRIGALDVLPIVPLGGTSMETAAALARRLADRIARELAVPTYLYGAASDPPGRRLSELRRGGVEALWAGFPEDRAPDCTPEAAGSEAAARPHLTAGVTCVGARPLLLAWNVEVTGIPLAALREVASRLRETAGGFRGLRVLAFELESRGISQLSMNLEDLSVSSPFAVFSAIESEIAALGGEVNGTEVIGMIPDALVFPAAEDRLGLVSSSPDRLLSNRLVSHVSARAARIAENLLHQIGSAAGRTSTETHIALEGLIADLGGSPPGNNQ
jgi:glutamate formiminotransferase